MHPLNLLAYTALLQPEPDAIRIGRGATVQVRKHAEWFSIARKNRDRATQLGHAAYDCLYSCQRDCESTLRVTKTNKCKSCDNKGFYDE